MSYAHQDRGRVIRLVDYLVARKLEVWWDDDIKVGEDWARILEERLAAAACVLVVWSRDSVHSRYVRAEARSVLDDANEDAVLLGVKLDPGLRIPLPFNDLQYSDLTEWGGGDCAALRKLTARVQELLQRDRPERYDGNLAGRRWELDQARASGAELQRITVNIGSLGEILISNRKTAADLRGVLREVHKTYRAVMKAVERFVAPALSGRRLGSSAYVKFEAGTLEELIESGRGHCSQIGTRYGRRGGLREWLEMHANARQLRQADDAFSRLAEADGDLFAGLSGVGKALTNESRAIVNLLVTGQEDAARKRILRGRKRLQPLQRNLNKGMERLQAVERKLGYAAK